MVHIGCFEETKAAAYMQTYIHTCVCIHTYLHSFTWNRHEVVIHAFLEAANVFHWVFASHESVEDQLV